MVAVGLQALALASQYFQSSLDGDYLYPQQFAEDVLRGTHPLSGWTLSSAPYFFPDFAGSILLVWLRPGAPVAPYYVTAAYLGLAAMAGWSLSRCGWKGWGGWLAGAVLVNVLLACRDIADHARSLWWLGSPGFHGGAVLLGLAQFSLWAGPTEEKPTKGKLLVAAILMFLGLSSDSLLLTQFLLPLGLALIMSATHAWPQAPRVRWFFGVLLGVILMVIIWRIVLAKVGWWHFSKVIRYAPTPAAIMGAARKFAHDLVENVPLQSGALLLVSAVVGGWAIWLAWRRRCGALDHCVERRQARWFALACTVSTLLLPIIAVYWKNAQHVRYLLPCFIIPAWVGLASLSAVGEIGRKITLGLVTIFLVGAIAGSAPKIRSSAWSWPYPPGLQQIDEFLEQEGLSCGLADYWNAYLLNRLSHRNLRLTQVRPDARLKFWNNNAFHYYDINPDFGFLQPPACRFIITDGLDLAALKERFGEADRHVDVGGYHLWIYDTNNAIRIGRLVDEEIRTFLGDAPGFELIKEPSK